MIQTSGWSWQRCVNSPFYARRCQGSGAEDAADDDRCPRGMNRCTATPGPEADRESVRACVSALFRSVPSRQAVSCVAEETDRAPASRDERSRLLESDVETPPPSGTGGLRAADLARVARLDR